MEQEHQKIPILQANKSQLHQHSKTDSIKNKNVFLYLLGAKKFAPFFWTSVLGAFNDNLFKSALIIMITYSSMDNNNSNQLIQIASALFILPFLLFSGIAGELAEYSKKNNYIRNIKIFELSIMILTIPFFIFKRITPLIAILFFMGAHSTFYGPVKYSLLPRILHEGELLYGNSLVNMSTFIGILLGTILGGYLISPTVQQLLGSYPIAITVVFVAALGLYASLKILPFEAIQVEIQKRNEIEKSGKSFLQSCKLNPISLTISTIKLGFNEGKMITYTLLLISWFWFYGFFFLASLPSFCRDVIKGDENVATFLLAMFIVGIACGSLFCAKIFKGKIHPLSIMLGSLFLAIMAFELFWVGSLISSTNNNFASLSSNVGSSLSSSANSSYIPLESFFKIGINYRVLIDLVTIGFFGGLYIVPLYTILQKFGRENIKARLIACNNILNAIFMVLAATTSMILLHLSFTINQIFLVISLLGIIALAGTAELCMTISRNCNGKFGRTF